MTSVWLHSIASILALVGMALIVFGLGTSDILWQSGLAVIGIAMLASFATRWASDPKESKEPREEV